MSLVLGQLGFHSENSPCHHPNYHALHSDSSETGSANSEASVCSLHPETRGSNDENRQAFQHLLLIKMENFRIWNVVCLQKYSFLLFNETIMVCNMHVLCIGIFMSYIPCSRIHGHGLKHLCFLQLMALSFSFLDLLSAIQLS